MKKLLTILAAVGLSATAGAGVVACSPKEEATSKVSLNNLAVSLNPGTQADASAAILKAVQGLKGAEKAAASDLTIVYKVSDAADATTVAEGTALVVDNVAVVSASATSTLLEGSKTIKVVAAPVKIDLSTNEDVKKIVVTNDSTEATVLSDLKKVSGLEQLSAADVTIVINKASTEATGSVAITANETSTIVTGTVTLTIAQLTTA